MPTIEIGGLVTDIDEADYGKRVKIMSNKELRERGFSDEQMADEEFGSEEFGVLLSEQVDNGTVVVCVDEQYRDNTHTTDDGLRELDVRMIQFTDEGYQLKGGRFHDQPERRY